MSKSIVILGTMSSAGKSTIVAGLCRLFANMGIKVAPFKAQNMSNNAAVCKDGGEIGRAQYLQAIACKIEPIVDMNPILLKPEGNSKSQVIVRGKVWDTVSAVGYYERKKYLWNIVVESLENLKSNYELIVVEGAGSPAELNLKKNDIVNTAIAKYLNAPTYLVGDIDRGGIFAQLLGTYWLLEDDEKNLIKGFIVNKFRGDLVLFKSGIEIIEQRAKVPVVGVVPYVDLILPQEDSTTLDQLSKYEGKIDICVIAYPHISNFDDFDALKMEKNVRLRFVSNVQDFANPDVVILPGSKNTISDLIWLKSSGFESVLKNYLKNGGKLIGICGGYQMLGKRIYNPHKLEGGIKQINGLGLLNTQTTFKDKKTTRQISAKMVKNIGFFTDSLLEGYEIHLGYTENLDDKHIFEIKIDGELVKDGAFNKDFKVWGTYIHGIFNNDDFREKFLQSLGNDKPSVSYK
ncbi:MAG: cobyric acid synthase, partial [Fervidobacterium sp.]